MSLPRATSFLALLTGVLLLAAGCGEAAKRMEVPTKDPKDSGVALARAADPIRKAEADVDGWTSTSWEMLQGAPVAYPELDLPAGTNHVSVVEYASDHADVADISGTTSDSRELTMRRLASQFEEWDEDEDERRADGAWTRGERSAEFTLQPRDGGTFFFVTVANRFD